MWRRQASEQADLRGGETGKKSATQLLKKQQLPRRNGWAEEKIQVCLTAATEKYTRQDDAKRIHKEKGLVPRE